MGAGWAATAITASAIGSVVPGVGTAVGAAVGLTIGLLLETKRGRRLKSAVERGVKKLYDDALSLSRKLGSNLKSKISGMFG
ncbi:MAG TPA: YtxH domain-containing protein [Bacillus bacterium]|nr:YtxH domain-containing protein [Bacillus sp. (in: firmicutes)]